MIQEDIVRQRLENQSISRQVFERPEDVVRWLGAVQAQDYFGSLWAVGLRMPSAVEADVEQAMVEGRIVRTHPMRGTWHFVAAEDIRWLLALTAPSRIASHASWYRRFELDDATIARSCAVFAETLRGGKQLTRRELAAALGQAGISTAGLRMTFLLAHAELEGVIVSGARRGKQFTHTLLDEMVPVARTLERDEALAELARRYFTSHGPATLQDFIWWSGLPAADARAGLEMAKPHLTQEKIDGKLYWLAPFTGSVTSASPAAYALPAYDEYTVAYTDRRAVLDPAHAVVTGNGIFSPIIVLDGRVAGTWKRTFKKDAVIITSNLFTSLDEARSQALSSAIERYSRFIGKPVVSPS